MYADRIRNGLIILAIVGGGAYLAWDQSRDSVTLAINEISANDLFDSSSEHSFAEALRLSTVGTRYANAWQVNPRGSPSGSALAVYLFDSHSARFSSAKFLSRLRNNCTSLASSSVIVCDVAAIDEILRRISRTAPRAANPELTRETLIDWIVGHELGHIVRGHSGRHQFHDGVQVGVNPNSVDHRQEIEADEFAAESLFRNDATRIVAIGLFIDLVNSEIVSKGIAPQYGAGLLFNYEQFVEVTSRCTHPEMTVRAIRMMGIYSRQMRDLTIDAMIAPFIRRMRVSTAVCGPAL